MGVYLSTTAYSPLALTSAVIGFVSFIFTLATFFKVVWQNLETMSQAPHDVHSYLTTLRTELLEEKANLRTMRRQSRRYYRRMQQDGATESPMGMELNEITLKTMGDSVRHMIRRFRGLEKPFLEPGSEGIDGWKDNRANHRRRSSVSPYYEHSAYAASPPEKGRNRSRTDRGRDPRTAKEEDEEEVFWAQRTQYAPFNVRRRFIWLQTKSDFQSLYESLSRAQIRRIARQVGGISLLIHEYGGKTLAAEETLRRIDDRTQRIVGVRRVE